MIEILFDESEASLMKMAKRNNNSASIIGERRNVNSQMIKWIPGKSEEVICLGFMLDIGNIKESVDSMYRKNIIFSMFNQGSWRKDSEWEAELKAIGNFYVEELSRLEAYIRQGEAVRIWYSDSPYSRCGVYFLCNWMKSYENPIFVVKLPEYKIKENYIISYQRWGEVGVEEFFGFLKYERELSREERRMYGELWLELVEENTPLRTIINGKIISVEEEFYDFFILKRLADKPMKQVRLIGDILGYYPIGIRDGWYAIRIEKLIEQGKVKILEDSNNKYARKICLV